MNLVDNLVRLYQKREDVSKRDLVELAGLTVLTGVSLGLTITSGSDLLRDFGNNPNLYQACGYTASLILSGICTEHKIERLGNS